MTDQRFIIELGMGNDLHGQDYTKAARRAIDDALRHSSIPMLATLNIAPESLRVLVTVGVQNPDAVDTQLLKEHLPHGVVTVQSVLGGLDVTNPDSGNTTVIASAAVEVFSPYLGV